MQLRGLVITATITGVIMLDVDRLCMQMWSLEFVEVADDELITKKLSDMSDDADTVLRDGADVVKSVSQPRDIPSSSSSVSIRHAHLVHGECSSSVDSDTGHMQYAVENWLSAEKQRYDDKVPTSHVVDTAGGDGQQHSTGLKRRAHITPALEKLH